MLPKIKEAIKKWEENTFDDLQLRFRDIWNILNGNIGKDNLAKESISNIHIFSNAGIEESKLDLNYPTHTNNNDPTDDQKAALAGTDGTPGSGNKYVTNSDTRLTNSRIPTDHASSHGAGQSDALSGITGPQLATSVGTPFKVTTYTATSGTHTFDTTTRAYEVEVVGGGGGGGGAAQSATLSGVAAGAGSGGYSRKLVSITPGTNTATYKAAAVDADSNHYGKGGAAGNNNGVNGDSSTWSDNAHSISITANGGSGSTGSPGSTGAYINIYSGSGGSASGGDINITGGAGDGGFQIALDIGYAGRGGSGRYGFGPKMRESGAAGENGIGYGSGGSGGATKHSDANKAGGNGAPGLIIVKEYK